MLSWCASAWLNKFTEFRICYCEVLLVTFDAYTSSTHDIYYYKIIPLWGMDIKALSHHKAV